MEILRITDQSRSLEEHYAWLAGHGPGNPYAEVGRRMLELLRHLPAIDGPPVWAVTSHADLHLVPQDGWRDHPWWVAIRNDGLGPSNWFGVEYPMPAGEAPWPGARVLLASRDVLQACEMVAYGLSMATGIAHSFRKQAEPAAAPGRPAPGAS